MMTQVLNKSVKNKDAIAERKADNDEKVENFFKKFGILKKASVLLHYGRPNDAWTEICKAAAIMQKQKEKEVEVQSKLENRWQVKLGLGLSAIETPIPINKITSKDLTPAFLKEMTKDGQSDPATMKLYLQNVCPMIRLAGNRDVFINQLIEEFYLQVEDILQDKKTTLEKLSKNIERLGEIAELQDTYGSDIDKEENAGNLVDSEGNPIRVPKKRTKMCPQVFKRVTYDSVGITMAESKKPKTEDDLVGDEA